MDGICRVCLDLKKNCTSLFEEYKSYSIFDQINSIANITICKDDGLPDKICLHCLQDFEVAINFKLKCENSNNILLCQIDKTDTDAYEIDLSLVKEEPEQDIKFDCMDTHFTDVGFDECDNETLAKTLKKKRESQAVDLHLQCDDCKEYFKSKCKLRVHWKRVHLRSLLKCTICKRTFKSLKAYNRHNTVKSRSCKMARNFLIQGEGKSRTIHCRHCKYKSVRMKDMITHWVIHTGDRPFKCDMCEKTCTQQSSLQAHKESAHKEYKLEVPCHICGKFYKGRNTFYRHMKQHKKQESKHQCQICQKLLKNKSCLNQHMIRHTGSKSFTCEKCAHTFWTRGELANHNRTVHEKGKFWYNCDKCDYKSTNTESVRRHKLKHTASNVPCTVCGTFFDSASKMILHQRRHFVEKKFECPHCETKFCRKDSVRKHLRVKHKDLVPQNKPKSQPVSPKVSLIVKEVQFNNKFEDVTKKWELMGLDHDKL